MFIIKKQSSNTKDYFIKKYLSIKPDFKPIISNKEAIRVNTIKISPKKLKFLLEKKGFLLENIYFPEIFLVKKKSSFSLTSTIEYLNGLFFIQSIPSQLTSRILNPKEDDVVIDMAAAPGGKLTHLAQLMNNKGMIIGLDNNFSRLKKTAYNIERLSIKNSILLQKDSRYFFIEKKVDKILLDAPCSGNYCLQEDWFLIRNRNDIIIKSKIQKELLKNAFDLLKKDGLLVYSTCTLEPEENEEVISWALKKLNFSLEPIPLFKGFSEGLIKGTLRSWPQDSGFEGFFIAKLKKN